PDHLRAQPLHLGRGFLGRARASVRCRRTGWLREADARQRRRCRGRLRVLASRKEALKLNARLDGRAPRATRYRPIARREPRRAREIDYPCAHYKSRIGSLFRNAVRCTAPTAEIPGFRI